MFFHPQKRLQVHHKHLPHWRQDNVIYFVTSRLADSMPQQKLRQWQQKRRLWLEEHGLSSMDSLHTLPDLQQQEFHRQFTALWHQWLDNGYGACWLRQTPVRQVLINQLHRHDSKSARLDAWVVMPNHFHALVHVEHLRGLGQLTKYWKGGSAREINKLIGRTGSLWQQEPYDHIVRSEAQLQHYRRYIGGNPLKARLKQDDYAVGMGRSASPSANEFLQCLETSVRSSPQPPNLPTKVETTF